MKQREQAALEALADALASKARRRTGPPPPPLQLVARTHAPCRRYDDATRRSAIRRIRLLARSYNLQWLLEQETFGEIAIESVSDEKLAAILTDMETARQCIFEGATFEDAGLVRDTSVFLVSD